MQWQEVPARRVLEVSMKELDDRFEARGDTAAERLFIRDDGRVFRVSDIQPDQAPVKQILWLTDI